MELGG